jgi:hypothetical protein
MKDEGDGNESGASDDTASPQDSQAKGKDKSLVGVCPFTGVSESMAKVNVHDEKKPEVVGTKPVAL